MRTISFQMQGSIVLTPTLAHEKDLLAYAAAREFQESYYTGIEVLLLDSENQGPGVSKGESRKWIFPRRRRRACASTRETVSVMIAAHIRRHRSPEGS